MTIEVALDVSIVVGICTTIWHSVMLWRETAVARWYWAEAKRQRLRERREVSPLKLQ